MSDLMLTSLTETTLRFRTAVGTTVFDQLAEAVRDPEFKYIVTKLSMRSDSAWATVEMERVKDA